MTSQERNNNPKVSFFDRNIKNKKSTFTLYISDILDRIKQGEWQDIALKIANEKDKDVRKKLKENIPYFTPSGEFEERAATLLKTHSGLIGIDLDDIDDISKFCTLLENDPYTFAVFKSVSLRGLCVLVKVEPEHHLKAFLSLEHYYWNLLNWTVDPSCKDVSRARFVTFDPGLFHNPNSQIFTAYVNAEMYEGQIPIAPLVPVTDYDKIIENLLKWWDRRFGFVQGQKNNNLLVLAQSMNEYGIPQDYASGYIQANIVGEDVKRKEVENVVNSAYKRTKSNIKQFEDTEKITKAKAAIKHGAPMAQVAEELGVPEKELQERLDSDTEKPKGVSMKKLQLYVKKQGLKFNTITIEYEDKHGKRIDDRYLNSIWQDANIKIGKVAKADLTNVIYSELVEAYNPIKEYLNNLKWDGKDCIRPLAECINTETGDPEWRYTMVKKWLYGIVHTAMTLTKNSLCLVFAGQKNTGKTEWFLRLLPKPLNPYFAGSKLDHEKDAPMLMASRLIIFDDEYSGKSKQDSKKMKMLLDANNFTLRVPYGKNNITLPRLATLCGTCNELEILNDPTGNRRIIVMEAIGKFNFAMYNSVDKVNLFGQLMSIYKEGNFAHELTDAEIAKLEAYTSRQYAETSLEEELILQFFEIPISGVRKFMTTSMIKVEIEKMTNQRLNIKRLGVTMRALGFPRVIQKNIGYGYEVTERRMRPEGSSLFPDEKDSAQIENPFEMP